MKKYDLFLYTIMDESGNFYNKPEPMTVNALTETEITDYIAAMEGVTIDGNLRFPDEINTSEFTMLLGPSIARRKAVIVRVY